MGSRSTATSRSDDDRVRISTKPIDLDSIEAAATGNTQVPLGTDIGHIHLEVSLLGVFRDFYADVLGFEVQMTVFAAASVSAGDTITLARTLGITEQPC